MAAEEDAMTAPIRQTTSNGRTMSEVLQDIVANIQEIVRSEFRLAKVEIHEETTKAVRSSIPLVIGVLLSLYALVKFRRPAAVPARFNTGLLALALTTLGLMIWTANLGGKIRHSEIGASSAVEHIGLAFTRTPSSRRAKALFHTTS